VVLYSKGSPWKLRGPPSTRVSYDQTSFPVCLFSAYSLPAHDPIKRRLPLTVGVAKIQPPVSNCHNIRPLAGFACPAARQAIAATAATHISFISFGAPLPPATALPHQLPRALCSRADCGYCRKSKIQSASPVASVRSRKARSHGLVIPSWHG